MNVFVALFLGLIVTFFMIILIQMYVGFQSSFADICPRVSLPQYIVQCEKLAENRYRFTMADKGWFGKKKNIKDIIVETDDINSIIEEPASLKMGQFKGFPVLRFPDKNQMGE